MALTNDTPISKLRLSVRAYRRLQEAGMRTLADINARSDAELRSIAKLGRKTLIEIRSVTRNGGYEPPFGLTADLQAKVEALDEENRWLRALLHSVGLRSWRERDPYLARDAEIIAQRLSGLSYAAIADAHGITGERVRQVCDRCIKRMRTAAGNFSS